MRKIKFKKGRKVQSNLLEYTGTHKSKDSEMQLFVYDSVDYKEYQDIAFADLKIYLNKEKNNWLNIHGLNDVELLKAITTYFGVDEYILVDILNTNRRTKLEEFDDVLFFSIKSMLPSDNNGDISVEQISFLIKKGVLISFQEKRSDFFTHIRQRIRKYSGVVRTKKVDYLLCVLLDSVMENFYITLEHEEDKLEELINITKGSDDPKVLEKIEQHRDNFNLLKRSILPLRDSLYSIKNLKEDDLFSEIEMGNFGFFSRLHHKSLELLEQIEYDLGSLESASNFFFSAQAHKMNEIMKTLTIISAIFIPLTFIVGVYGMNFNNMPELQYKNGYYLILGVMFLLGAMMVYYFKKQRWF